MPRSGPDGKSDSGVTLRRGLRAALVAALVFLVSGAGFGVASGNMQDVSEMPLEFGVAVPHDQDRFTYSLKLSGSWVIQANDTMPLEREVPAFDFAFQGTEDIRLQDGLLHRASKVNVVGPHYTPYVPPFGNDRQQSWTQSNQTGWLNALGLLANEQHTGFMTGSGEASISVLGVVPVATSGSETSVELEMRTFATGPCLTQNGLQGHVVSIGALFPLFQKCHLGGLFLFLSNDTLWRAAAMEMVGDVQTMRFDSDDPSLQAWFNPAIPYPVQLTFTGRGAPGAGHATAVLRLTGFESAGSPLPAAGQARDPAPALEWAPTQPWGPNDEGTNFTFPLSEAFERARNEPDFPDLRQFLAAHPEAYTVSARSEIIQREYSLPGTSPRPDGEDRSWQFTLSDGDACFHVRATRSVRPASLPPLNSEEVSYSFQGFGDEDETKPTECAQTYPPPESAPTVWPTIVSANALWYAYATPDEAHQGPNGWNFHVFQYDGNVSVLLAAGQAADQGYLVGSTWSAFSQSAPGGARLNLQNGAVVSIMRAAQTVETYHTVAGLSSPQEAASSPAGTVAQPTPGGITGAFLLSPAQAAGAGVFALLAGALYWIWPTLKGTGALGLFSRLREDQVLAHPRRAELLQRTQPGIHYQDLLRAMGGGKGGLEHHLRQLEATRHVRAVRGPYYTCYFPWAAVAQTRLAAPALKSDGARRVLAAVRAQPGISGQELAARTGLSASSVSEHVTRLSSAGLVEARREGRTLRVVPTSTAVGSTAAS